MKYYIINTVDILMCSENCLVACWDGDLDCPLTAVCDESKLLFSGNDVIEIDDKSA